MTAREALRVSTPSQEAGVLLHPRSLEPVRAQIGQGFENVMDALASFAGYATNLGRTEYLAPVEQLRAVCAVLKQTLIALDPSLPRDAHHLKTVSEAFCELQAALRLLQDELDFGRTG